MKDGTVHMTAVCEEGEHAKCPGKAADVERWVFHDCNCACHLNQAMSKRIDQACGQLLPAQAHNGSRDPGETS